MATTTVPKTRMTFEEFLAWAGDDVHAELVDGEVELLSPVSRVHQHIGKFLLILLNEYVTARQLGEVFYSEFLMRTGQRSGREPDLLFVATDHLDRVQPNYLEGPADLTVEIVSPESQRRDRVVKLEEYRKLGVREYWLIEPEVSHATFYQLQPDGTYQVAAAEDGIYRSAVIDGLWIDVNWLWQRPLPTAITILKRWELI